MNFEFATATRILFGDGKRHEIAGIARSFGRRGLLVAGRGAERAAWLRAALAKEGCECVVVSISGEPTIEMARAGAERAREAKAEFVIGLGGGSVIDAAKAIAALATNTGDVMDYLEVIGKGQPLTANPLPFIAVPTTAGTGAEVTRNAVLASPEHQVKVSLRSPKMLPIAAVVDPELTYGLSPEVTAYSGLDALTQLIEAYVCLKANPISDALCREALPRVATALPVAYREAGHQGARRDMAIGSLFGGLALANAGLGAVHGFAAPIGGMFKAPHGAVCAALLPGALAVNLRALNQRKTEQASCFDEVARLITGSTSAQGEDGVQWVQNLCRDLKVPGLRRYGVTSDHFDVLCDRAAQASSMKTNPIELTRSELREVLEAAL